MKSVIRTVVWVGLVTTLATFAVLAPQIRATLQTATRTPSPATQAQNTAGYPKRRPADVAPFGPSDPATALQVDRCDTPSTCPIAPLASYEGSASPRSSLMARADGPQVAATSPEVANCWAGGSSTDTELRRLLAAPEPADEPLFSVTAEAAAGNTPCVVLESRLPDTPPSDVDADTPQSDAETGDHLEADVVVAETTEPQPAALPEVAAAADAASVRAPGRIAEDETTAHPIPPADPAPLPPWPLPEQLIAELERLSEHEITRPWAATGIDEIRLLRSLTSLDHQAAAASLARLERLVELGKTQEKKITSLQVRIDALRTRYALERRLAVWRPVMAMALAGSSGVSAADLDAGALAAAMAGVDQILATSEHHEGWRQFLNMTRISAAFELDDPARSEARRLARQALARIESTQLAASQRKFLTHSAFDPLKQQLRLWAAEPVDLVALLRNIEELESNPRSTVANGIADQWNRLRWAPQAEAAELTRALSTHYRNANMRIAVSAKLLNRLLPIVQDMDEDVNENILGSRVIGRSRTSTQLSIRLIPDPHRWRLGLEARGDVNSQTSARVGMVRIFNRGESSYLARQLLQVSRGGIEVDEPEAGADAATELTDVRTDVDGVPLLSNLVRGIAQSQAERRRHEAAREVESRIAWRARRRMADEVGARVSRAEEAFDEKVLSPLQALDLEPVATQMLTTSERLISRARLAGYQQLAANTPRPRAAADSLLSIQVHQSAVNNVIEQLGLDGAEYELHDLYRELVSTFTDAEVEIPEDLPENVTVQFADEEAVSVRFEGGRVALTIRIQKIHSKNDNWRDFEIRGYYFPESGDRNAGLVRDGTIEVIGEDLGFRDKIPLRLIFNKVLSKKRKLQLIHERLMNEPRLQDVEISQYVIDNGWIGIALAARDGRRDLVARPAGGAASRR